MVFDRSNLELRYVQVHHADGRVTKARRWVKGHAPVSRKTPPATPGGGNISEEATVTDSVVSNGARVLDDAKVGTSTIDDATVSGDSLVEYSTVNNKSAVLEGGRVMDGCLVTGGSVVKGNAWVTSGVILSGKSSCSNNGYVDGDVFLQKGTRVEGRGWVQGDNIRLSRVLVEGTVKGRNITVNAPVHVTSTMKIGSDAHILEPHQLGEIDYPHPTLRNERLHFTVYTTNTSQGYTIRADDGTESSLWAFPKQYGKPSKELTQLVATVTGN